MEGIIGTAILWRLRYREKYIILLCIWRTYNYVIFIAPIKTTNRFVGIDGEIYKEEI